MTTDEADWLLLVRFSGADEVWAVQISKIEIDGAMKCMCESTGAVYEAIVVGRFNSSAGAQGKRIVEFTHLSGDRRLEEGFRMRPMVDGRR